MSLYTVAGYVSSFFFFLCLIGLWIQLRTIWKRKSDFPGTGTITSVLSLNHFVVRFIAFFAIFVLGFSRHPFNPYLVFPYLPAVLLLLLIVREIYTDRRDLVSGIAFYLSSLLLLLSLLLWGFGDERLLSYGKSASEFILLCTSVLIAQSDAHQIYLVRKSGGTGAVSLRTHQTTIMKDLTAVLFGLVMGTSAGWAIIVSAGTSSITKGVILYHFHWVRTSRLAEERRRSVELASAR